MTKYLLTDYERNGYDDSDFYCTYWDDQTKSVRLFMYGTTRFAAPTMIGTHADGTYTVEVEGERLVPPTSVVVEEARQWLASKLYADAKAEHERICNFAYPGDLRKGDKVVTKKKFRNQLKETKPCEKCAGSGKWTNPRNASDLRECFSCEGTGKWKAGPKKDDKGKIQYRVIPEGTEGTVLSWESRGQFYANGYNKPNPFNTTLKVKLADGTVINALLDNVRLVREWSEPRMREAAESASYSYEFSRALDPRHAWDTHNYAARLGPKHDPCPECGKDRTTMSPEVRVFHPGAC